MKYALSNSLLYKIRKKKTPLRIHFELTNRCNLECVHCFRTNNKENKLVLAEIKDILVQLRDEGCIALDFTGGEPLLREDFFEIANFARKKGFAITIFSNGTTIDRKNIRELKKLNPIQVQVSLYGISSEIHELTTQVEGSFARTMRAVSLLKKYAIPFNIATVLMKHNFSEIAQLKSKAKYKGWELLLDCCIYPRFDNSLEPLKYRITNYQIRQILNKMKKDNGGLQIYPFVTKDKRLHIFDIWRTSAYISSKGEVFPSNALRMSAGDLRRDTFHNIWHYSPLFNRLRKLKITDFECSRCKCYLRCCWDPGLSWLEHGDFTKSPQEICRFTKIGLRDG